MFEFGTRLIGLTRPITEDLRLEVGKIYEIKIRASRGVTDSKAVADYLLSKLKQEYPEIQVVWMKVCEKTQTIDFQFTTLSAETLGFEPRVERLWVSGLLVWLPTILTLLGIAVAAISAYQIVAAIPWYVWALLGTGAFLLIFGPAIASLITGRVPKKYRIVRR